MYSMFTVVSTLHSGPVPKQFHHLKGPWARWLSPPHSSPDASSVAPAHSSCPSAERLGTGRWERRRGLFFHATLPPWFVMCAAQRIRADQGHVRTKVSSTCSGQSHASDAYSSSDHRAVRGGGMGEFHPPTVCSLCELEGTAWDFNQQLTILQRIIHDAG